MNENQANTEADEAREAQPARRASDCSAVLIREWRRRHEDEIWEELQRAIDKFPKWPSDPLHAKAVIDEESGELTQAILQHIYEPGRTSYDEVKQEAIQTAAMAIRFVMALGFYRFERGHQHYQWDMLGVMGSLSED